VSQDLDHRVAVVVANNALDVRLDVIVKDHERTRVSTHSLVCSRSDLEHRRAVEL
jgi:hypothetical protein